MQVYHNGLKLWISSDEICIDICDLKIDSCAAAKNKIILSSPNLATF